jgi:FAD/FMN-containing dehydrogenase
LDEAAASRAVEAVRNLPDDECEVFFAHVGGAMARVAADATPFPSRDAHFVMNVHTRWRDPARDAACKAWARALFDATEVFSAGSAYVNFVPEDEPDRVAEVYGANLARLAGIKARYDPDNLFRLNHNILPVGAPVAAQ